MRTCDYYIQAGQANLRRRTINAYLVTVCSSYEFLKTFYESGAHLSKKTLHSKVKHVASLLGRKPFYKFFTRSFNPQRRQRAVFLKHRRKSSCRDAGLFFRFFRRAPPVLKLKANRKWQPKQTLCKQIREYRNVGPFLAKNFWQNYTIGGVQYPRALNAAFGEVGPGGRAGINILLGFPPDLMKACGRDSSAAFYADQATRLRKKLLRHPLLQADPSDNDELRQAKQLIIDSLSTIEGLQFLTCEWSKIVNYCATGNCTYERGYWNWWDSADDAEAAEHDSWIDA